jgi:hypothetical protein
LRGHVEGYSIECGGVGKGYSEGVVVVVELLSGDTIMPEGHEVVSRDGRVRSGVVPDHQLIPNEETLVAYFGRKAMRGYKSE